jgi:putative ATP-dependent endonuclease of OLD family
LTYNRGELFFAKIWLLVEGETEYIFLDNLLNKDGFLDKKGIRIIQYAHIGAGIILKIARELFMPWFMITDGDTQGQSNREEALSVLPQSVNLDDYIYTFTESTIEVYLMNNGFASIYCSRISPQNSKKITEPQNSPAYNEAVYQAIKNSINKPEIILDIVDNILTKTFSVPPIIEIIREKLEKAGK